MTIECPVCKQFFEIDFPMDKESVIVQCPLCRGKSKVFRPPDEIMSEIQKNEGADDIYKMTADYAKKVEDDIEAIKQTFNPDVSDRGTPKEAIIESPANKEPATNPDTIPVSSDAVSSKTDVSDDEAVDTLTEGQDKEISSVEKEPEPVKKNQPQKIEDRIETAKPATQSIENHDYRAVKSSKKKDEGEQAYFHVHGKAAQSESNNQTDQEKTPYLGQSFVPGVPARERVKLGGTKQQGVLIMLSVFILAIFLLLIYGLYEGSKIFFIKTQKYEIIDTSAENPEETPAEDNAPEEGAQPDQ